MKQALIFLFTLLLLSGCTRKIEPADSVQLPSSGKVLMTYYDPAPGDDTMGLPQLTLISNGNVQFTFIGNKIDGHFLDPHTVYVSTEFDEWMVLLNENRQAQILYQVDSENQQLLPLVTWIDRVDVNRHILRIYDYDWETRLGTLLVEAEVNPHSDEAPLITFNGNAAPPAAPAFGMAAALNTAKTSKSFPAPVMGFHELKKNKPEIVIASSQKIDEYLDEQLEGIVTIMKDLKETALNRFCDVAELVNNPNANQLCGITDATNNALDETVIEDIRNRPSEEQIRRDENDPADYTYRGNNNVEIDTKVYDNYDDIPFTDPTEPENRHLVRRRGTFDRLSIMYREMMEKLRKKLTDLNDLSDKNGVLQIGLSWNTDETDIDLYVTDPAGETIYYDHPNSASNGYLDRDDTDGRGPENIYWHGKDAKDGLYSVKIHYYGPDAGPYTDCYIKIINGLGVQNEYVVKLAFDNAHTVCTFSKNGSQITFHN